MEGAVDDRTINALDVLSVILEDDLAAQPMASNPDIQQVSAA